MRSSTSALALALALVVMGTVCPSVHSGEIELIAYGGILRQFEPTGASDMGLQGAVTTAVGHRESFGVTARIPDMRCFGHP